MIGTATGCVEVREELPELVEARPLRILEETFDQPREELGFNLPRSSANMHHTD